MLLSVERDVVTMQEEAVKPPPSTASSGLRATDFSIAAIMARESPGQLQTASASSPAAAAAASAAGSGECLANPLGQARSPLPHIRRPADV